MNSFLKLNAAIVGAVISIMYFLMIYLYSFLLDLQKKSHAITFLVVLISAVGTYRLLVLICQKVVENVLIFRKLLLSNSYLEGTWIGYVDTAENDKKHFVEYYKQDLLSISISGFCKNIDGKLYATWNSESAFIEEKNEILTYSYVGDIINLKTSHRGYTRLLIERVNNYPHKMEGYAVDSYDGIKLQSYQMKISDKRIDIDEALLKAKEIFDVK